LPRSDTARARRPKGAVAMFQYQVSQYESAGPAEDHTLSLRRASRVSALKGGTGDYAIGWKRRFKIEKKHSAIPSKMRLGGLGCAPIVGKVGHMQYFCTGAGTHNFQIASRGLRYSV